MEETINVSLKTLTPIWTGDNERQTTYLRATSFLGSLRFWTEALLRSTGETICNNSNKGCTHSPEEAEKTCPVCKLFGCTGLSRSFSLKILDETGISKDSIGHIELKHREYQITKEKYDPMQKKKILTTENKIPKWPLTPKQAGGIIGGFCLSFSPLRPQENSHKINPIVLMSTYLMLNWGMLGAKDQYGYGLVEIPEESKQNLRKSIVDFANTLKIQKPYVGSVLPDLRDFFFFNGSIIDQKQFPVKINGVQFEFPKFIPFEIRYLVRSRLRKDETNYNERKLRHYFCGDIKEKQATKFNMGQYQLGENNILTGWGYFPRKGSHAGERDACLNILEQTLTEYCINLQWKEFNSTRDTEDSRQDWLGFIQELVADTWR
jgi:CRISPR type III-B/RAMP module RAMP protein Cmr1